MNKVEILLEILGNELFSGFAYLRKFRGEWKKRLEYEYKNNTEIASLTFGEIFDCDWFLGKNNAMFRYTINVSHLLSQVSIFDLPSGELISDMGELSYDGYTVSHDLIAENEIEQYQMTSEGILLFRLPILPIAFSVVDGNHRLSYLRHQGQTRIPIRLVPTNLIYNSIQSSAERATYLYMHDLCLVTEYVNNISDRKLYKSTIISNYDKTVKSLLT